MRIHQLKTVQPYFDGVASGCKPFDLRINDRDFRCGDVLVLREYDAEARTYSGREVMRRVTYVLDDQRYVREGIAALGLADDIDISERGYVLQRIGSNFDRCKQEAAHER